MKRSVTTKEFIEWYFKIEDAKWVLKELKFNLYNSGKYSLDLYELFEECASIPAHITVGYNHREELGKEYLPTECKLIN